MDLKVINDSLESSVYHITSETKVPLHKHKDKDEVFYCIKGSGFGVLADGEVKLTVGEAFIVLAGTMHSLRSEDNLYVTSFIIPIVDERL